jgi:hypothetical protein
MPGILVVSVQASKIKLRVQFKEMLKATQYAFYEALFDPDSNLDFVRSTNPNARMAIYKRNIAEYARRDLQITFPGIWHLLSEASANSIAYAFLHRLDKHCSFPQFLDSLPQLQDLPYLHDYATYESLIYQANSSAYQSATTIESLQILTQENSAQITFSFIPSLQLFYSSYPIDLIHEVAFNPDAPAFRLKKIPTYAIIARFFSEVCTFWVADDLWHFVQALQQGQTLKMAAEKAMLVNLDFNLTDAIYFLLAKKIVQQIRG